MRFWIQEFKDTRILRDITITDDSDDTRTHKVLGALEKACYEFDLSRPIWLDSNIADFKRHSKVRFTADSFIDTIDFDFLLFQVLDED